MEMNRTRLLILGGIAAAIMAGSMLLPGREPPPPAPVPAQQKAGERTDSEIVVYVTGAVNRPGIVRLPAGARGIDAVQAAGGMDPAADAARINLAQTLKDGMQFHIPATPPPAGPTAAAGVATGTPSRAPAGSAALVSINLADKAELEKLPGIGPALAGRIVEYRAANGYFGQLTDLKKVPGIGDSKYNQIKDRISL